MAHAPAARDLHVHFHDRSTATVTAPDGRWWAVNVSHRNIFSGQCAHARRINASASTGRAIFEAIDRAKETV